MRRISLKITKSQIVDGSLVLLSNEGMLRLRPYSPEVVRITYTLTEAFHLMNLDTDMKIPFKTMVFRRSFLMEKHTQYRSKRICDENPNKLQDLEKYFIFIGG